MVIMGMTAENNFDVVEAESQFFHAGADYRYLPLEACVDQNVSLRCRNQERRVFGLRSDKINVADHLKRRKRRRLRSALSGQRHRSRQKRRNCKEEF